MSPEDLLHDPYYQALLSSATEFNLNDWKIPKLLDAKLKGPTSGSDYLLDLPQYPYLLENGRRDPAKIPTAHYWRNQDKPSGKLTRVTIQGDDDHHLISYYDRIHGNLRPSSSPSSSSPSAATATTTADICCFN